MLAIEVALRRAQTEINLLKAAVEAQRQAIDRASHRLEQASVITSLLVVRAGGVATFTMEEMGSAYRLNRETLEDGSWKFTATKLTEPPAEPTN